MIPTPTPFPTPIGTPVLDLESYGMVAQISSNAIQGWNMANQDGLLTQFQWFVILAIVFIGIGAIIATLSEI